MDYAQRRQRAATTDRATAETDRETGDIERRFEHAPAKRREGVEKEGWFSQATALIRCAVASRRPVGTFEFRQLF